MRDWIIIFFLTWGAGLAMFIGALVAMFEHISNEWLEKEFRHSVISFGGGILIAAVALVLVPEGMRYLSLLPVTLCFLFGGLSFMLLDILLNQHKENVSQLVAMLLDFVPEVVALGSIYILDKDYAFLLGLLIVLQNLPEGFNAYRELRVDSKYQKAEILWAFLLMSFLGPIAGLSGYYFLSESPHIVSGLMLFAAGGMLYLVFQDIAPEGKLRHHWGPALGAVVGFLFAMIGKILIG